jgi:hypothetical protein
MANENNTAFGFGLGLLTGCIIMFFVIALYSSHAYGRISEHKTCNKNVHQQEQEYIDSRYPPKPDTTSNTLQVTIN